MSDISYLSGCSAAGPPPLPQGPGFWQRSRRGNSEWCNSARGPNTLFFPLWCGQCARWGGAIALIGSSSWTGIRLQPRLTPRCASLTPLQLHPHEETLGIDYRFLVIATASVTSQLRAVDGSAVITFWIYMWRMIDAVGSFANPNIYCRYIKNKTKKNRFSSRLFLLLIFFFLLTALFWMMVAGRCRGFVLLDSDGGTNPPIWGDTTLKCLGVPGEQWRHREGWSVKRSRTQHRGHRPPKRSRRCLSSAHEKQQQKKRAAFLFLCLLSSVYLASLCGLTVFPKSAWVPEWRLQCLSRFIWANSATVS